MELRDADRSQALGDGLLSHAVPPLNHPPIVESDANTIDPPSALHKTDLFEPSP